MNKSYEAIKFFLENSQNTDQLWESNALIEIDWRGYDEEIVNYFNHATFLFRRRIMKSHMVMISF